MKTDGKWKNTEGTLLEVNDRRIFLLFYGFRQNTLSGLLDSGVWMNYDGRKKIHDRSLLSVND